MAVSESDWAKFGLSKQGQGEETHLEEHVPHDSLFAEDQRRQTDLYKPWWRANFFLREPVLFGTWDGVFTSVMVNIFGVIVFLRMGWIVGNAGIGYAVLLLILCASLALVPVLSAVGICERCQIQSGGVYFLVSHILGGQIGGAVGIMYTFGQAVGSSFVAIGFGESMNHLIGGKYTDWFTIRLIATVVLVALVGINVAGVKWVVKLQLILLALLVLAVCDLVLGSFFRRDINRGVVGFSLENFRANVPSNYTNETDVNNNEPSAGPQTFWTVFGVFFSNFIGVLAGVNMSGDLKDPSNNIPLGELAAVGCSSTFCFLFIMILGGVCTGDSLKTNTMIAETVSATRFFFLAGLYISSLSSLLGSMYGAPRVLQGIASENVIPVIKRLETGKGPNKVPVLATVVLTVVSFIFLWLGNLNQLALLATMPFLITYAFVNYSYVSLAMTYDLQQQRELREYEAGIKPGYGSMGNIKGAAAQAQETSDLDHLFPERQKKAISSSPTHDPEKYALTKGTDLDSASQAAPVDGPALLDKPAKPTIINQPQSWYSLFCNRWISLIGAIVNIVILFPMNFWFALAHLLLLTAIYTYIGQAVPGVFPGISEFSIPHSIRTIISKWRGGVQEQDQVVVAPLHPAVDTFASRLTEDNTDYASRKQYHQTKTEQLDHEFD